MLDVKLTNNQHSVNFPQKECLSALEKDIAPTATFPLCFFTSFMAVTKLLSLYIFRFYLVILQLPHNNSSAVAASLPPSSDVELLLGKIRAALQDLFAMGGLKGFPSNGSPLSCNDLSSHKGQSFAFQRPLFTSTRSSASFCESLWFASEGAFRVPMLQSLYLEHQFVERDNPIELGWYSFLTYDVVWDDNMLSGALPPSIWNLCDKLVSLRLHGNMFAGLFLNRHCPNLPCKNLQFLDLGNNKFSGVFPEFITRFGGLKQLDLGNNMFTGSIPQSLAGLIRLEKRNLSHNNFSGVLTYFW
ncbi:putative kinase-like protein TMKL1 [Prosopis cineraria]|uniref:putative kinase-like protein TMKL1 n=1 Tax=Prosopis cineraria TaxID=364024 RepID=UPI0024109AA1|nr:putative kinase-like protein TMKL1 [Prosopis cineraria]